MTTKIAATADQLVDQMLHRFLEIIFKIPFEPWAHIGTEFLTMILAYTVLLAYGKILATSCRWLWSFLRALFLWPDKVAVAKGPN